MRARDSLLLTARTAAQLRPAQVAHRLRLRAQRATLARLPALGGRLGDPVPTTWGWPAGFVTLDNRLAAERHWAERAAAGELTLLGETRRLGDPPDWEQRGADQLWRYHLHYFEWARHLGGHPDRMWAQERFGRLWRSWSFSSPVGRGDAWSPYVASLRAWSVCGAFDSLVVGTPIEHDVVRSLAVHAGFLRRHLELDVGGNHLVKNLKALVGLGVFLGDDRLVGDGARRLDHEVDVQVLADGGHVERSPSYHAQVLGDLVDVAGLLTAAGMVPGAALDDAIARMRAWLAAMVLPDGDVALFNDCTLVGGERLAALGVEVLIAERVRVLDASGYVIVRPDARLHLVLDAGLPCPPWLPAHAHADTLSFELAVDGRRIVVDTGTSTYEDVPRRAFERSTAAHNTIEVDDADSTEVWGRFRAARRAHATIESIVDTDDAIEIVASHDGYRRLPGAPVHRRTLRLAAGRIDVVDDVLGTGVHRLTAGFHLASGVAVEQSGPCEVRAGELRITTDRPCILELTAVATDFGELQPATRVIVDAGVQALPARIVTILEVGP